MLARYALAVIASSAVLAPSSITAQGLKRSDLSRLRSVGAVQLAPDGRTVAYTVTMRDRPGRPYAQLWIMDLSYAEDPATG